MGTMRPARPLFIDGRKLPGDPSPAWQGYSVGRWEGDTLVIETAGFNKRTITITDPQTFTKPITFSVVEELLPDTDHLEHCCAENERDDAQHAGQRTEKMIRG